MITAEEKYMRLAIEEAKQAKADGDYSIGALVVLNGEVIAKSGTRIRRDTDATAHAEVTAIREACKKLNTIKLTDCILYTTHEPCAMCAGAAVWAQMKGIVFGATMADMNEQRAKTGSRKALDIPASEVVTRGEPILEIAGPLLREECKALLYL
jgi:tRNA(Arg) A34 adenosine deaminase TadA